MTLRSIQQNLEHYLQSYINQPKQTKEVIAAMTTIDPDEQSEQPDIMHQTVAACMSSMKAMVHDIQPLMSGGMPVIHAILLQHALSCMVTAVNFMGMMLNTSPGSTSEHSG